MITKRITTAKTMPGGADKAKSVVARGFSRDVRTLRTRAASAAAIMLWSCVAILILFFCAATPASAQESALDKGPAPPYVEPAPPPEPAEPTYDPVRADKSVEVGTFYLKRGNYDAAIERFQDATHFQPKLAKPYALMGEAYERKGDLDKALASYKKYLEVFRTAPDRDKILKRIEKLESQSGHTQGKEKTG